MSFLLYTPKTLNEAFEMKKKTDGRYLAAGTVVFVKKPFPSNLISLEKIPELYGIRETETSVELGALVTFDEIDCSALIKEQFHSLWQAAHEVGSPQIRNRATIGGNVCSFDTSSDGICPLKAMDASVVIFDGNSLVERKITKFDSLENGEILVSVRLEKGWKSSFVKVGKRNALAISVINMTVAKKNGIVRVAVGSAGKHVLVCEKTGKILSNDIDDIEKAQDVIGSEIYPRAPETKEYKLAVARNILSDLVKELAK